MPVQTTYSTEHAAAYEGMLASTSELVNSRSYFAEGSNILPGRGVVVGTDPAKQCSLPDGASVDADFLGITQYELNRVHDNSSPNVPENQDRPLTVVNQGTLYVNAKNGASVNDDVFVVIDVAGGDALGEFRSDADAGNAIQLTGAKFISAATAGNLAKVSIDRL